MFYRRSAAFLHFHEDPAGFFADVRIGPGWLRLPATTAASGERCCAKCVPSWRQARRRSGATDSSSVLKTLTPAL